MSAASVGRVAPLVALGAVPAGLLLALAAPAAADHGVVNVRAEGLSPLALGLITGGLALAAALLVLVIAMLLTRKTPVSKPADE